MQARFRDLDAPAAGSQKPKQKAQPKRFNVYDINYFQWNRIKDVISDAQVEVLEALPGVIDAKLAKLVKPYVDSCDSEFTDLRGSLHSQEFRQMVAGVAEEVAQKAIARTVDELSRTTIPSIVAIRLESAWATSEIGRVDARVSAAIHSIEASMKDTLGRQEEYLRELEQKLSDVGRRCADLSGLLKRLRAAGTNEKLSAILAGFSEQ